MVFNLDLSTLSELVRPRMLRTLSMARGGGRGGKGGRKRRRKEESVRRGRQEERRRRGGRRGGGGEDKREKGRENECERRGGGRRRGEGERRGGGLGKRGMRMTLNHCAMGGSNHGTHLGGRAGFFHWISISRIPMGTAVGGCSECVCVEWR